MWRLIQNQLLGMDWLRQLTASALSALGLDVSSRLGGSVHFFLYDMLKISLLLCVLIFGISYLQSFFPPERSRRILGRFHGIRANLIGALLGTVTPFCSCSSIPIFMGFAGAGLPLGVIFSFLISSPMVDLGSLVLLTGIFGVKVAAAYVVLGLLIAVAGGTLIEKLPMEEQVEAYIRNARAALTEEAALTTADRLHIDTAMLLHRRQGLRVHPALADDDSHTRLRNEVWFIGILAHTRRRSGGDHGIIVRLF